MRLLLDPRIRPHPFTCSPPGPQTGISLHASVAASVFTTRGTDSYSPERLEAFLAQRNLPHGGSEVPLSRKVENASFPSLVRCFWLFSNGASTPKLLKISHSMLEIKLWVLFNFLFVMCDLVHLRQSIYASESGEGSALGCSGVCALLCPRRVTPNPWSASVWGSGVLNPLGP